MLSPEASSTQKGDMGFDRIDPRFNQIKTSSSIDAVFRSKSNEVRLTPPPSHSREGSFATQGLYATTKSRLAK